MHMVKGPFLWGVVSLVSGLMLFSGAYVEGATDGPVPQAEQPPLVPWTDDFDAAKESARKDGLPIYLYVTGSSWCIWCKTMDREIHNQDGFRQKTIGIFHFVKIDLPAGGPRTEKMRSILETYHVVGVPTIILLSPDGAELARFRYEQMAPEAYADLVLGVASRKGTTAPS